ncbi:MAG: type II toxin-antitoxin system RelE/ParE family toxin [Cyanobacteriota/Melainabacteria group bacterium]|nr:type II toxin-antitoxin system RelE/ParE family toxin [Cyanobacteria bacterium HKST-UBA01]MCB9471594.1 type II toxin-antitoxin system RelE/ParE family toxin [Candidatus Obscuribacterales bacterium]HMO19388.1 type II toxin-antitoxin system RelE/ParE family toxin [Candidatus Melainabacteria bacterium]HMP50093.1 type II toxin-antitoxin system RelE/ParE family toxin [Candidatus Melainabacteria bacterium]
MSIQSFGDGLTEKIFLGIKDRETSKFPQDVLRVATRKLDMLEAAAAIQDLASPPANRLEKLKGDLRNYWSIRVNDQWRIIFEWTTTGPHKVKIIDYH